jgi:hypothetical protein
MTDADKVFASIVATDLSQAMLDQAAAAGTVEWRQATNSTPSSASSA